MMQEKNVLFVRASVLIIMALLLAGAAFGVAWMLRYGIHFASNSARTFVIDRWRGEVYMMPGLPVGRGGNPIKVLPSYANPADANPKKTGIDPNLGYDPNLWTEVAPEQEPLKSQPAPSTNK